MRFLRRPNAPVAACWANEIEASDLLILRIWSKELGLLEPWEILK
jgi:hypothetical protein